MEVPLTQTDISNFGSLSSCVHLAPVDLSYLFVSISLIIWEKSYKILKIYT